ncbi:unnamed protein product [Linum trigynum]|uniref:Uncharacterized protein n=1 Tax=Linum trigynum TaxID=586398 RepID=A0AAV2E2E0_9ROSI
MANSFTMANSSFIPFFLPFLFLLIITTMEVLRFFVVVVQGDPDLTIVSGFCGGEYDVSCYRHDQARELTTGAIKLTTPGGKVCGRTYDQPPMYYKATCSDSVAQKDCTACMMHCRK